MSLIWPVRLRQFQTRHRLGVTDLTGRPLDQAVSNSMIRAMRC